MKVFLTLAFAVLTFTASAQNMRTDSLKQVLNTHIHDTIRIRTLNTLSSVFRYTNPDSAMIYARQSRALAIETGYLRGELQSIYRMAAIFYVTGNYPQSMEHYLLYLRMCEANNYQRGVGLASTQLANIYNVEHDEKLAIEYATKAKDIFEALNQPVRVITPLIVLGNSYFSINLDSSLTYMMQAHDLAIKYNRSSSMGIIFNNLGEIYAEMNEDEIAMGYFRKSLKEGLSTNYVELMCASSINIAKLLRDKQQSDSALYYSRIAMSAAYERGFTERILEASEFLSSYYKELGLLDSAYHYQGITLATKDSVFSQEKVRAVQNLGFMETIRQQEIQEAKVLAEEKRKSNIQMLGVGTSIPLFFILLFLISRIKVKPWVIRFMGLLSLLLLFEFISLLIGQFVEDLTNNNHIITLLILVVIASILVPFHNKIQKWIGVKLGQQI
jgi:tetratricopeptide (TPR) repeat protein